MSLAFAETEVPNGQEATQAATSATTTTASTTSASATTATTTTSATTTSATATARRPVDAAGQRQAND